MASCNLDLRSGICVPSSRLTNPSVWLRFVGVHVIRDLLSGAGGFFFGSCLQRFDLLLRIRSRILNPATGLRPFVDVGEGGGIPDRDLQGVRWVDAPCPEVGIHVRYTVLSYIYTIHKLF